MQIQLNEGYAKVLIHLKEKIKEAQMRASFIVNKQLLESYWETREKRRLGRENY
jgi:hypothetical protein